MLRAVEFKDKRFMVKYNNNLFSPITKNAIILCHNYKLMDSLSKEIIDTVNGLAEYNDYDCDDEDVGSAKLILSFGLQRIIDINGKRITLALEPEIIYKASDINDIWFFDYRGTDDIETLPSYEEFIYPMIIFKDSHAVWNDGKDEVYKMVCDGRYGTYDGKWVDLHGEHWDEEAHNCVTDNNMHLNDFIGGR